MGKWAESPQTLVLQRFQPARFWNKSGQKPTFFGQNAIFSPNFSLEKRALKKVPKKVGRNWPNFSDRFPEPLKNSPPNGRFSRFRKAVFFADEPVFTAFHLRTSVLVRTSLTRSKQLPHTSHQLRTDHKDCPPDTILHSCSSELIRDVKRG